MKPSKLIAAYSPSESDILQILDGMAEDITRLKEMADKKEFGDKTKYFSTFIRREWEE